MKLQRLKVAGCLIGLLAVASTGQAQVNRGLTQGPGDAVSIDMDRTANGIPYISGGIGNVAQDRFKTLARQGGYNMMLVFTFNTGEYLADVNVNVRNQRGVNFDVVADGPFLAAKVPPGAYTVTARYKGNVDTKQVRVGSATGTQTSFFRFPVGPDAGIVFAGNEPISVDQPGGMTPRRGVVR